MSSTHCDRDTFLQNLQKSGLVSAREFARLTDLPDSDRGRVIARAVVEKGLITKFQAELLLIGRTHGFFLGQYKILDQLGQGGMGRVYKAMHLTMKRVVALKVLAPQLVRTSKAMKLFKREVRSAGQLHHPNIVTAYDANHVGNRHYLVMEYVDGPNLDQLVRRQGPLPPGLACEIIRQAACGLQHAHELGMVHHDIKPANFLVQRPSRSNPTFTVKVLDFGLARLQGPMATDEIPKENTVMGTPDFLSPEQARNLPTADIRSDIYSLGCTFYFLLAGRVPFPGGSTLDKLLKHSAEDPVTVELFRSDVPAGVVDILRKMMAKKPEDRFQTPYEIVEALTPYRGTDPFEMDAVTQQTPTLPTTPVPQASDEPATSEPGLTDQPALSDPAATIAADSTPTPPMTEDALFPFWTEPEESKQRNMLWIVLALAATIVALAIGAAMWFMS